ncbi:hypothetical protein BDN67DRAFT_913341, partial [Paxillus ammoniavirescens]
YKAENLYLVGVIPSPREPSLDEINHFLHSVVNFFLPAWKDSTWFTKTSLHCEGRLCQSIIALTVNDLPVMRKISGFAGPTVKHLCNQCWQKKSNIGNFNCEKWRHCTD